MYDGPIAKKCGPTADPNYAIFYYGSNHSRISTYHFRNVFRVYRLKTPFHPKMYSDCKPIAEERPANVNVIQSIQRWTVHLVGYTILSLTILVCLHSFSGCRLPNLRNHAKFRAVRGRSRSSTLFKVIELDRLDANRKSIICNFLLIINGDCGVS